MDLCLLLNCCGFEKKDPFPASRRFTPRLGIKGSLTKRRPPGLALLPEDAAVLVLLHQRGGGGSGQDWDFSPFPTESRIHRDHFGKMQNNFAPWLSSTVLVPTESSAPNLPRRQKKALLSRPFEGIARFHFLNIAENTSSALSCLKHFFFLVESTFGKSENTACTWPQPGYNLIRSLFHLIATPRIGMLALEMEVHFLQPHDSTGTRFCPAPQAGKICPRPIQSAAGAERIVSSARRVHSLLCLAWAWMHS